MQTAAEYMIVGRREGNLSFRVDLSIFFRTIMAVLKREGITGEGSATMEEFMGTEVAK